VAIVKADHALREVRLTFDPAGEVTDVRLVVSYNLKDDVTNEVLAEKGLGKSVWASLTLTQQTALNTLGKRFKTLAETF
jgi:hypothetical protein